MIVKKIPAKRDSRHARSSRAKHVRNLVDYMRSPDKENAMREYLAAYMAAQGLDHAGERVLAIGGRNFVCEGVVEQRAEMMATAQAAVLSDNPIDHWLLSWREGEIPTDVEVDQAVAVFVEELGVEAHQCIYAIHGDTHNRHGHLALNRYNLETGKVVSINNGFSFEAAHKAVARIVHRFGWKAEEGARYVIVDGRPVLSPSAEAKKKAGVRPLGAEASAYEVRTGYRSAQRIAQEEALPILLGASGWPEIHAALAGQGITYDIVEPNGATFSIAGQRVKASDVSREAGPTTLRKRLGEVQVRDPQLVIEERSGSSDRLPEAFRADEYRRERAVWRTTSREERKQLGLKAPPPDLESWLHHAHEHVFAEGWRNRKPILQDAPAFEGQVRSGAEHPAELNGYRAYPCADGIRYARENAGTAFIIRGGKIAIVDTSDDAITAALKLAVDRYEDQVTATGSEEFRRRGLEILRRRERHCRDEVSNLGAPDVSPTKEHAVVPVTPVNKTSNGGIDGPLEQAAALVADRRVQEGRKAGAAVLRRLSRGPAKGEENSENRSAGAAALRRSSNGPGASKAYPPATLPKQRER